MDDALFEESFLAIVPPLLEAYQPDLVVTQLGVDTFHDDPLAHGALTTAGFTKVLQHLKALAPRWIATGGGGYNLANVARAWTLAWGVMHTVEIPDVLPAPDRTLLQQAGYSGATLRDPAVAQQNSRYPQHRAELHAAIAFLKRHLFPLHGLKS
jgi:acetoin utilization protein AcuC